MKRAHYRKVPPLTIPSNRCVLAYIAGLFDGEGCVSLTNNFTKGSSRNRSHSLRAQITNTDERLMTWLLRTVGGSVGAGVKQKANHKVRFNWRVNGTNAARFIEAIAPYLVLKKDRAELAMQFDRLGHGYDGNVLASDLVSKRDGIMGQIRILNRRGVA